jgi:DNA polymerase/3'-5' exonuclease PolX
MIIKELVTLLREHHLSEPLDFLLLAIQNNKITRNDNVDNVSKLFDKKTLEYYESIPLWSVKGLGPSKAVLLWKAGVRPGNLEKHINKLPDETKLWLKYKPMDRIPHKLVELIGNKFYDPIYEFFLKVKKVKKPSRVELVGSFRRQKPTSGDVDILWFANQPEETIESLLEVIQKVHGTNWIPISAGPAKIAGIYKFSATRCVEVDLWIAASDPVSRAAMRLYSTGSKKFNILMRHIAKTKGYKLNQYGLYDSRGKLMNLKSEEEIFAAIGLKYREPPARE